MVSEIISGRVENLDRNQRAEELLKEIIKAVDDKNARDILLYDMRGHSILSDYNIIVHGNSERQISAIAQGIEEKAKELGLEASIEGKNGARWVLVDLGDIIVHVFDAEEREKYQLESLWMESNTIDISEWVS